MSENVKEFVTLAEAAAHLDISERTIRRRIDSGELQSRKEGSKLMVYLPDAAKTGQSVDTIGTEVDKLKERIKALGDYHDAIVDRLNTLCETMAYMPNFDTVNNLKQQTDELEMAVKLIQDELQEVKGSLQKMEQAQKTDHDLVNQFSGALESLHRLIAYSQQSFLRKLFSRKQLPPPSRDVVDMEGKE